LHCAGDWIAVYCQLHQAWQSLECHEFSGISHLVAVQHQLPKAGQTRQRLQQGDSVASRVQGLQGRQAAEIFQAGEAVALHVQVPQVLQC
jgi:hypothetical protein